MMKLSTMKKLVATLNDKWRSPVADQIAARWGVSEGSAFYLRGSANFIFGFEKDGKKYILRFNEDTERKLETIEAELKLLQILREKGLQVCTPVQSSFGNWVETVETEVGTYYAVALTFVEGEHLEFDTLSTADFERWGEALGSLHRVVKDSTEISGLGRQSWRDQLTFIRETLPASEEAALEELAQLSDWAESLEIDSDNYGLIHFDFELDNLMWKSENFGIIDFDDSVYHWYVADIAFALRDLFEESIDLSKPEFVAFLKGYQAKTSVDTELIQDLQQFMRMHRLFTFARLMRSVDLLESFEHPDWLNGLIRKFHDKMNQYRSGFRCETVKE